MMKYSNSFAFLGYILVFICCKLHASSSSSSPPLPSSSLAISSPSSSSTSSELLSPSPLSSISSSELLLTTTSLAPQSSSNVTTADETIISKEVQSKQKEYMEITELREYREGSKLPFITWHDLYGSMFIKIASIRPPEGYTFIGNWKVIDSIGYAKDFEFCNLPTKRKWRREIRPISLDEDIYQHTYIDTIKNDTTDDIDILSSQLPLNINPVILSDDLDDIFGEDIYLSDNNTTISTTSSDMNEIKVSDETKVIDDSTVVNPTYQPIIESNTPISTFQAAHSISKLFSVFKFKGIGISFVKSLIQWNSFGFGVRIPLTPHFPEYDRMLYLPRFSTFVGLFYPFDYRFTLSISIPFNVATQAAATVGKHFKLASEQFVDKIKRSKATDSVKRVGVTMSVRYNTENGLRMSLGPWIFYLPGMRVMQHVLPVVYTVPAVITTMASSVIDLDPLDIFKADILEGIEDEFEANSKTNEAIANKSSSNLTIDEPSPETKRLHRGLAYWKKAWLRWAVTKTSGLGGNFGWYKTHKDAAMGSSVLFDVQPFFEKQLPRLILKLKDYWAEHMKHMSFIRNKSRDPSVLPQLQILEDNETPQIIENQTENDLNKTNKNSTKGIHKKRKIKSSTRKKSTHSDIEIRT